MSGLLVSGAGVVGQILVVHHVPPAFARSVVGDEGLQAIPDGVGDDFADDGVLCLGGDGDDPGLLVYVDGDILTDFLGDAIFYLGEVVGVEFQSAFLALWLFLGEEFLELACLLAQPRRLLMIAKIIIICGLQAVVCRCDADVEQRGGESVVTHQVGIECWLDGISGLRLVDVEAHRGCQAAQGTSRRRRHVYLWGHGRL